MKSKSIQKPIHKNFAVIYILKTSVWPFGIFLMNLKKAFLSGILSWKREHVYIYLNAMVSRRRSFLGLLRLPSLSTRFVHIGDFSGWF